MNISLGRVVILVEDYDAELLFYEKNLGARKIVDYTAGNQRFLHIGFSGGGAGIWFLAADGPEQESLIGNQTHQQPTLVMYTDEFENLYERLRKNGVTINRPPVYGPDSWYLHFLDLYGNEIVLVQIIA